MLRLNRWLTLTADERPGFAPLCQDLVVELASAKGANARGASPSDEVPRGITSLRRKMDRYQANRAWLGWLLLPVERAVEV